MSANLLPSPPLTPQSFGEVSNLPTATIDAKAAAILSIEGMALQYNLLPVTLLRESCSPEAERIVRKLGRVPYVADPWLPVTMVGPLLVMAHHNPRAGDTWGVPSFLTIRILISPDQYQKTRKDLVQRFGQLPIAQQNALENVQPPRFPELGLEGSFEWLMEHYPFEPSEVTKMRGFFESQKEKHSVLEPTHFNSVQRNLGPALQHLVSGGRHLCFAASEAQRQTFFPLPLLERHTVYPLYIGKNAVFLLSENTDCYSFEDEWLSMGNPAVKIIPVLADPAAIRDAINRAGATFDPSGIARMDKSTLTASVTGNEGVVDIMAEDMARINPSSPNHTAEELVQWALFTAIRCRASDLHLEKFYNLARFRARMDGNMKTILTAPESQLNRFVALLKNYAGMNQNRQECQDGRFSLSIGRRRLDVRVAAVPTRREFQKVIMRFLDKQDGVKRLSDFNLSQRQIDILTRTMTRDQGLVLVTGPTGSGKTTTLYALLNSVNDDGVNIQTIEDPIEYEVEGINQTQTNHTVGLDFANGLRSLLRADPDIILIGESRDAETANAAVNAALTGHLVLTTLHANDSLRAVSRLMSMGVEKYLLADSLALSQAQRLVRRLCTYCKRPMPVPQDVQELMAKQGVITQPLTQPIYSPVGCQECHGTGYSGRVALMELCEISSELRDLIEEAAPMSALRACAFKNGFFSLYQEGLMQVIAGHTSLDEIKCLAYTAA
ncbi:GspE/PulE family protein [Prosthecobacter dejongeii]|uniref:Type II secretory ATPase GspE/PulE/Tfp pilus assembly ATPase PilB-like protein n=1 Tax=Prosthecobacter dejongeii TaxID=48465 RepID=A0A7W7YL53_9BACT|nr:GspE/PulE family protein [Prosthecobacter dejongeii]MBB5038203.1 type II secretory ATPase GspE/PulE/Tfp pilus assembly ATPase PilB-like protein [Prosthecobacter dejongeii]